MAHQQQIKDLKTRLARYNRNEKLRDDDGKNDRRYFKAILKDACAVVRRAQAGGSADLAEIVSSVSEILNEAIDAAYGDLDLYDFMPSFAHADDASLVEEQGEGRFLSAFALEGLLPILRRMGVDPDSGTSTSSQLADHPIKPLRTDKLTAKEKAMFRGPQAWTPANKRHPLSTPLARFTSHTALTPTSSTPLANIIYQARCEVTSDSVPSPIGLSLSAGNTCLALNMAGGYKNRDPVLNLYLLNDNTDFPDAHTVYPKLSEVAREVFADEERKLVWLADSRRVKSFSWVPGEQQRRSRSKGGVPMHTLASGGFDGPLAVLANGTVVRAGKGSAAMWKVDELDTHLENELIGEGTLDIEDSWRDDPDEIELSSGNERHSTIEFTGVKDKNLKPSVWTQVAPGSSTVLSATGEPHETSDYSVFELDLAEGKVGKRYLGHGGIVMDFSVSAGDPNVFLTACTDGYARLYDRRETLPVVTFDVGALSGFCPAGLIVHPDGIPTAITGALKQEEIKVWDVRARAAVYELATGNNGVTSLAWDSQRSALYAATECNYVDRLGYHHDYRPAKLPKRQRAEDVMDEDGDEDEDEDDEEDFDDECDQCWPSRAWHKEDYFGYTFDAGDHRIYRFAFKENPDLDFVPCYGDATREREGFGC
ncbi:hypothetical protein GLOTRDRAFT_140371 [Gloeophyllum trabeum ATCC 11539]|uniref:WD40 repeat-like protein n=1 Tax=Gloeophyllum trabeum (strain ATCC 11539 / FP-39264 / Madison 617) TaxID=670483 RepID=S7RJD2_GLOTA|nr:uncharacterized protein GLOTRDRAFT_140371 [Gloeophyllum trabeum ATCC 11539]EPQ52734.1 hypothetical protein GLOTRDRAFT_140371 [Gloeophyllum trabeum ATCC 11539]